VTTEERLYKLEGIVEGVMATLPGQVASLEGRMELLRQELRAEIADLRQEVKAEIAGLRQEMKAEIAGLRQEMKAEINTALNRLMLYFTALAAGLALLTLFR
jgi:predicted  nucleic acid-binding Zn-ribbon protein